MRSLSHVLILVFAGLLVSPLVIAEVESLYLSESWNQASLPADALWGVEATGMEECPVDANDEHETPHAIVKPSIEQVYSGERSLKAMLSSGMGSENRCRRAEVAHSYLTVMAEEYSYKFSLFLPDPGYPKDRKIVVQWHGRPDKNGSGMQLEPFRSPPLSFTLHENGRLGILTITSSKKLHVAGEDNDDVKVNHKNNLGQDFLIPKNQWVQFEVYVRWSNMESGYLYIWMNNEKIVSYHGGTNYNDDLGPYLKLGIYSPALNAVDEFIYYDELTATENDQLEGINIADWIHWHAGH